jgi:hypothetical protein
LAYASGRADIVCRSRKWTSEEVDSSGEQGQQYEIRPGDIISFAPDEKHWHGAGPKSFMAHFAINPGKATCWMDKVTDEEYQQGFKS